MGVVFDANTSTTPVGVVLALHASTLDGSSTVAHLRELIAEFPRANVNVVASDASQSHTTTWVRIDMCSLADAASGMPVETYDGLRLLARIVHEMDYAAPTLTDPSALRDLSKTLAPVVTS